MKTVFFGTPNFAVPFLEALISDDDMQVEAVVTRPDKPVGRGNTVKPTPVKKTAEEHDISVHTPTSLKTQDIQQTLRQYDAEVFVVVAYGRLIPEEVLNIPPMGCVNVHPSILPKYRGPAPMQAAIYHGDEVTGMSIMKLDAGMDTGPLLDVLEIELKKTETYPELKNIIEKQGPPFLLKTLKKYKAGDIKPTPQSDADTSTTSLLSKEDGRIDWTRSAKAIEQKIRAYNPWPGTWTTYETEDGQKILKIHQAEVVDATGEKPGKALIDDGVLLIETGDEALQVHVLQPENKPKMTAQDFLNGHSGFNGVKLQ